MDERQFEVEILEFSWREFEWNMKGSLHGWKGVINSNDVILNLIGREGVYFWKLVSIDVAVVDNVFASIEHNKI